jgi:hypothetical protein
VRRYRKFRKRKRTTAELIGNRPSFLAVELGRKLSGTTKSFYDRPDIAGKSR